ncbi:RimJ/RimL family protein N-acetyltransferase [Salibacterium salarium]|uniref:GNAT family N-acetyltransferase n=1 Tax=Salibacterium salarium TaxID=284579 RepID=UPI0027801359|nr:GNAT family protein [Salibacterium salarium]MDQ0300404.1 RimJ/RimL family protein N-acetyltransferase [Salibacterium salarium]
MSILFERLTGDNVVILPMEKTHSKALHDIGQNKIIWTYLPKTIETYYEMSFFVEEALANKEKGLELLFVILDKNGKVLGSSRFLDISSENKSLEIGWTWLTPNVWGTKINTECKYLLLKYCFESLELIRVQFKTDEKNIRSQKAIERIGGVKEGILRNHMICKDGTFRNSVFYSIIKSDWESVKSKLKKNIYYS